MKTKYYSEELKKYFDTEEECLKAEKEYLEEKEKKNIRKREKEEAFNNLQIEYSTVQEAYKRADALYSVYLKHRKEYLNNYESSCSNANRLYNLFDLINF